MNEVILLDEFCDQTMIYFEKLAEKCLDKKLSHSKAIRLQEKLEEWEANFADKLHNGIRNELYSVSV